MRKLLLLVVLVGLGLAAHPARAQFVISAPIAEGQAEKQAGHQGILTVLKDLGNTVVKKGNDTQAVIKSLEDQTVQLHDEWYTSLLKINSVVSSYQQVKSIWNYQNRTMSLYTQNIGQLRSSPYLTPTQIQGMVKGYTVLLTENVGLLDDLTTILTPGAAKMTDAQRLKFINKLSDKVTHQYQLVSYFTKRNQAIVTEQAQAARDNLTLKKLYGL
jgi:archaellum component FlaG (FlaF/FlaG flagellin family)